MVSIRTKIDDILYGKTVYPAGSVIEDVAVEPALRMVYAGHAEWVGGPPALDEHQRNLAAYLARQHKPVETKPKPPTGYWAKLRAIGDIQIGNRVFSPGDLAETDDCWTVAKLVGGGHAVMVESKGNMSPEALARFHELSDALARDRKAAAAASVASNLTTFRPTLEPARP